MTAHPSTDLLLAQHSRTLTQAVEAFVEDFYAQLESDPSSAAVLHTLSPQAYAHLRQAQAHHFRQLVAPGGADVRQHAARTAGSRHTLAGVPAEWVTKSYTRYAHVLLTGIARVSPQADQEPLRTILMERLFRDLQEPLQGIEDVRDQESLTMMHLEALLLAPPGPEWLGEMTNVLVQFEGICGAWLGQLENGGVRLEAQSHRGTRAVPPSPGVAGGSRTPRAPH